MDRKSNDRAISNPVFKWLQQDGNQKLSGIRMSGSTIQKPDLSGFQMFTVVGPFNQVLHRPIPTHSFPFLKHIQK
jgi:hypothetical protein